MKKIPFLFIVSLLMAACRSEIEAPKEYGAALYPQNIGTEVVYQVDSIVYDDFLLRPDNKPDTFTYQLREVLESKFTDNSGKQANRVVIYKRLNDSFNWEPYQVVSTSMNLEGLQRLENNFRYIKLAFPVAENKTWNGNALNAKNQTMYKYISAYKTGIVGKFIIDSLVTVQQEDDSNFVEKRYAKEIYAPQIGLIYGRYDSINYQVYNQSTQRYYWKGLLIRKTMISHK